MLSNSYWWENIRTLDKAVGQRLLCIHILSKYMTATGQDDQWNCTLFHSFLKQHLSYFRYCICSPNTWLSRWSRLTTWPSWSCGSNISRRSILACCSSLTWWSLLSRWTLRASRSRWPWLALRSLFSLRTSWPLWPRVSFWTCRSLWPRLT